MTSKHKAISFRLNPQDSEAWAQLAYQEGLTPGTLARRICTLHLKDKVKTVDYEIEPDHNDDALVRPAEPKVETVKEKQEKTMIDNTMALEDDEKLTFVEESYTGERDSAEFRRMMGKTDRDMTEEEADEIFGSRDDDEWRVASE
jgi:hypothetical protein